MKVLVLGSHLNYNLEHYVKAALERLKCEVDFVGHRQFIARFATPVRMIISRSRLARAVSEPVVLRKYNEFVKSVALRSSPQLLLSVKGEAVLPETLEWFRRTLGGVTALWYPDDPRYFDSLAKLIAPHYDFVFTASERAIKKYRDLGVHVEHLPFACDPSIHKPIPRIPPEDPASSFDICFVGTFSRKRYAAIKMLETKGFRVHVWGPYWTFFKKGNNVHGPVFGLEMSKVLSAAKIVLNIHDDSDLNFKPNMRVFEATGCGSVLLTDRAFGLERMFDVGREVLCYEDGKELVDVASRHLGLPEERLAIAARAQRRAYGEHTYEHRMKSLTNVIVPSIGKALH